MKKFVLILATALVASSLFMSCAKKEKSENSVKEITGKCENCEKETTVKEIKVKLPQTGEVMSCKSCKDCEKEARDLGIVVD